MKLLKWLIMIILSMILIISCKSIYGFDQDEASDGGSSGGGGGTITNEDGKVFPAWYLTEEQQQKSYFQGPTIVFDSRGGTTDPQIYHIPAIIVADNGNIIAFGDDRHRTGRDVGSKTGPIDIVYKISKDGGKTWSEQKTILPASQNDVMTGIENKGDVSVFKCQSGKLVALAVSGGGWINGKNANTPSRMVMSKSMDNGETWTAWKEVGQTSVFSKMKSMSPSVNRAFASSGRGTTLKNGRLATAMLGDNGSLIVFYLYSDDEGETWNIYDNMGVAKGDYSLSEPKIVGELDDGGLLMSVRNGQSKVNQEGQPRMYGYSTDSGINWGTFNSPSSGKLGIWNTRMKCGNVNGEGIVYTRQGEHDKTRILQLLTGPNFRRGMNFWLSEDNGRTFRNTFQVIDTSAYAGKYNSGYTSLDVCGDGTIVTLCEEYNESNTKLGDSDYDLVFRRYNMKALMGEVYKTEWYKEIK